MWTPPATKRCAPPPPVHATQVHDRRYPANSSQPQALPPLPLLLPPLLLILVRRAALSWRVMSALMLTIQGIDTKMRFHGPGCRARSGRVPTS